MLRSIIKLDEQTDTSKGYFYDHLHNQIYFLKNGQLLRKHLQNPEPPKNVPLTIHSCQNKNKIFPTLVKVDGNCRLNAQKTSFTAESFAECKVRTDVELWNGAVWSWYVPTSLSKVKLGIVEITKNNNFFETYVEIVASSSRTITFLWNNGELKTWVNGESPSKNHIKKLKLDPARESKFYALASCRRKGQTLIFNSFQKVPKQTFNYKFKTPSLNLQTLESKISSEQRLKRIAHLNKDKLLLQSENSWIKIIHRNSQNSQIEFGSVSISGGHLEGLINAEEFNLLKNHCSIQQIWQDFQTARQIKANQLKPLIQDSLTALQTSQTQNQSEAFRILLQKACILRTLSQEFELVNPVLESELDRQFYSETLSQQFFDLARTPAHSFCKSKVLNEKGWTKIEGKIEDVTENYILVIDEETVIIYHIGDEIKEVFKQNIVFFQFNKSSFLQRYNEVDMRIVQKGQKSSSIYKLLMNCFTKVKKVPTELFPIKENDLKELINDYKIGEIEAKISLEQTGNVQDALAWLSRPENERVYIQKPEQIKNKNHFEQLVCGQLLQLQKTPLAKLLLRINNNLYLLGYDPINLRNFLTKSQKQFINLFDFKRETSLQELDQSQWFSSQTHETLTIIDVLNLNEKANFLFKQNQKVYVTNRLGPELKKAQVSLNSKLFFQNQPSIYLGNFEPFGPFDPVKDYSGYLIVKQNQSYRLGSSVSHTFVYKRELFSTLGSKVESQQDIELTVEDQSFSICEENLQNKMQEIPLLIKNGPPGCNLHYSISSVLTSKGGFLANYPHKIIFRNAHEKYMKVSTVIVGVNYEKLTVNSLKEGSIHFQTQFGVKSKIYHFKLTTENQPAKEIEIDEKGFWKFMILTPHFDYINKSMPFEFGFVKVRGTLIEKSVYQQALTKKIQECLTLLDVQSLQKISFEVKNVIENSNRVLNVTVKINQLTAKPLVEIKPFFKKILQITKRNVVKPELPPQQEEQDKILKNLEKVGSKQFMDFFSKTKRSVHFIKQINKKESFSFKNWKSEELKNFIDIALAKAGEVKTEIFRNVFNRIEEAEQGKIYVRNLCKRIGKCQTVYPQNQLSYLIKKISSFEQKQTLRDLLNSLKKFRSADYKEIRKRKIPYLLLEDSLYSRYYTDQIEKHQKNESKQLQKLPIFEEQSYLAMDFVVFRDELSRKIYVRLEAYSSIDSVVLRFDSTELQSRIYYRIYSLQNHRALIQKGSISEHQWVQITKNSNQQNTLKSSGQNAFVVKLNQTVKTSLLQIEILYNEAGLTASDESTNNFPLYIDIIPEIYGEKVSSSPPITSENFSSILNLFDFENEEGFYLSLVEIGLIPIEKYSVSKENEDEYLYFKPSADKTDNLRNRIADYLAKNDYFSAIPDHIKLVSTFKTLSKKPNLDYVYTLLMITFDQIFSNKISVDEDLCKQLFELIIREEVGPIRIAAFQVTSGCANYLIKSLPYIEEEGILPNLEQTTFHKNEIEAALDLNNIPLCNSLNKLVVNSIPYEDEWAKFLIKISPFTNKYEDNINYILKSRTQWYKSVQILAFFNKVPQNYFSDVFLNKVDFATLQKFILQLKQHNMTSRVKLLVNKLIQVCNGKIESSIVKLMLQEDGIDWHNLYKIIKFCPQEQNSILSRFLEQGLNNPSKFANLYPEIISASANSILNRANFARFLFQLFKSNRSCFKNTIASLCENVVILHSSMLKVFTAYLHQDCNLGGIEGAKLLQEEKLLNIQVALSLYKMICFPTSSQIEFERQEETLVEWYFYNNSYEHLNLNPASKSPGLLLMKKLSDKILERLQKVSIDKIFKVFDKLIKSIQRELIATSTKHIYVNQLNEGVFQLLQKNIRPDSLSSILIGGDERNGMLQRIFESLAVNSKFVSSSQTLKESKWNSKQVDLIQKFAFKTSLKDIVKDWKANRNGSKNFLFKINLFEKKVTFQTSEPEGHILNKILIGFICADNLEKNNLYPSGVQVFGGRNQDNLVKICDLNELRDQHFECLGTRVYGANLNSLPFTKCLFPVHCLEFRVLDPLLTSVSDVFENPQKTIRDGFYSVSFVSLMGNESEPKIQPEYNQIYMTLLQFLGNQKYSETLKSVVGSNYYKANSAKILCLLNSLLPNKSIEKLLLALNNQNQDVLGSLLENQKPNIKLVSLLLEANPSCENIQKLIKYFMSCQSAKLTPIIVSSTKLFGYSKPNSKIILNVLDLIKLYENSSFKESIFKVLSAVLSTPSAFDFDYGNLVQKLWKKQEPQKSSFLKLIGSTIGCYSDSLKEFLSSGKTEQLVNQLISLMSAKSTQIYNHIYLLSQLSLHNQNRLYLINKQIPLVLVNLLRNDQTLLNKQFSSGMKYFLLLFQSTCIQSVCERKFSQILIEMMVSLPKVAAAHHGFFIHEFFFPLINAFKGVPIKFVWKNSRESYLYQATHALKTHPIKCSEQTQKQNWDQKITSKESSQCLTNQTLIKLKNLGVFGSLYLNAIPIQDSTFQKIYYLPCQMTLNDILKQLNFCGYRLNQDSIQQTQFYSTQGKSLKFDKEKPLEQILPECESHLAMLEVNPENFFSFTSIDRIAKNKIEPQPFIPLQTIFKSFEKQQGLFKMITVLKTCVKNWKNSQQSTIWEQYLNELQSYSCFPVFSSLYMNKQDNVQLLFNILSGLPDKEDSKKWLELEKSSVKFLYSIVKNVFEVQGSKALQIRRYAVEKGFYPTMLNRLHLISKEAKRIKVEQQVTQEQIQLPKNVRRVTSEEDYKLKVVKKKGIGYGNDSSSNQKWDIVGQQESRKQVHSQILDLLKILQKFLDHAAFEPPKEIIEQSYQSALLPILEASLRGGSLLEISKSADLFKGQLSFIKALTKKKVLVPILMSIPKYYEPKQHQSVFVLLKVLESTSRIFLSCLTGSVSEKLSQQIAKNIIQTYEMVDSAISNYELDHVDEDQEKKILELPLTKKYPILLKDLRFDYIDMKDKNGKISKHHYYSNFIVNHKCPSTKTIRLAQELADISHALPVEHTNAIYVRCDKERVDFMQALIMGSNGTPYGHGAYLFDIYFDDTYPNNPPKVNLTTTGNGQIRFNPNLYSCGKVCLSLLGTWRGNAMENWDSKVSTLLQILVSIQSIIMSEEVYFNEPGFEQQQGTIQGEKKNQAYANIVRYGNIKFAMIENMKNPPMGFQSVIKRHFYLKKDEILVEVNKWLKFAEKREASYTGLVSDHNNNWCNQFKKSKTQYRNMLEKAIKELEQEFNKLPEPSHKDLRSSLSPKKEKKKRAKIQWKDENIEQVDVAYDKSEQSNLKQLDINDEKVKDRWSRYIGAMGIEAVSKQSKASILLFGLGATGVQIAKNIILSGCKRLSIVDQSNVQLTDLSGQFFLDENDIGNNRVDACLYKLQELNHYVRVESLKFQDDQLQILKSYDVVILTQQTLTRQKLINNFCHKNQIKFIITDCYGPFGQQFNDFGNDFQVIDKNGEETVEVMIENITNAQKGVVTLLNKQRHPYEDFQVVRITGVKGMTKANGESINGTIHKIRVINQYSFEIGNTLDYCPYEVDGLARNMKLPIKVEFKTLQQSLILCNVDSNLSFYDYEKGSKNQILHKCFIALSSYRQKLLKYPSPWNWEDGQTFASMVKQIYTQQIKSTQLNYIRLFAYTCSGTFAPLAAFYGGLTAQEAFKAITGKYMPINQYFFTEFTEVAPSLPESDAQIKAFLQELNYKQSTEKRNQGLRRIICNELIEQIEKCRVFLIGSGAIGCQLLKNFAMINLATSKDGGQIIVTDPDHIEQSNLNRQFLFREKHLRKPKSVTAAAAILQMNKLLKGKIRAQIQRVCQNTKDIFSNQFFESLNIVANALDNVKARQYVDQRCVENKVALLESGTLGSKGHVQVILPYLTESYGSKADPAQQGQIPHCTLKMFPEETLHCVQWARDIFGKTFTLNPKALSKLLEKLKQYHPISSDLQMLKVCLAMLEKKPKNFDQAVQIAVNKFFELYRNDIKQLLYTYPLDAKTKDGKPFWKLPKRPPTPIEEINPAHQLHFTFISSYSVLLCKIFNLEYPKDFRKEERRSQICKMAAKIKVEPFVPNDKLAKQMADEVDKNQHQKQSLIDEKTQKADESTELIDEIGVFENIKKIIEQNCPQIKVASEQFEKDDDQNGHIDLIYSMANLRAENYKLEPMDWMTTKLKAGKITPALSTTTSCVAALQSIQLIKFLKKCKLDKMRNTFLNLAVPLVQTGQPGEVEKIKIHDNFTTNIWERWEIGPYDIEKLTVGELLKNIEEKYKIKVTILSILQGSQIYSNLVMGLESKKAEREEYLKKSVLQILSNEIPVQDLKKFVDLTIVFATNENLAEHVPTLRLKLSD